MRRVAAVIWVVLFSLGCQTNSTDEKTAAGDLKLYAVQRQSLTPEESATIDSIETSLRWFARRSSAADSLWRYYQRHARRAVYQDDDRFFVIDSVRSNRDFFVVVMPYEAPPLGQSGKVAGYNPISRRFGIVRTPLGMRARGVVALHEMQHVVDYLVEHQVLAPKGSPSWYDAELVAYRSTTRILDQATHGAWTKHVVEPSVADRDEFKRRAGMTPWSFTWAGGPQDSSRVARVFGKMPHLETNVFIGQLDFDANLQTVVVNTVGNPDAQQRGTYLFMERYCGIVPR